MWPGSLFCLKLLEFSCLFRGWNLWWPQGGGLLGDWVVFRQQPEQSSTAAGALWPESDRHLAPQCGQSEGPLSRLSTCLANGNSRVFPCVFAPGDFNSLEGQAKAQKSNDLRTLQLWT